MSHKGAKTRKVAPSTKIENTDQPPEIGSSALFGSVAFSFGQVSVHHDNSVNNLVFWDAKNNKKPVLSIDLKNPEVAQAIHYALTPTVERHFGPTRPRS